MVDGLTLRAESFLGLCNSRSSVGNLDANRASSLRPRSAIDRKRLQPDPPPLVLRVAQSGRLQTSSAA